jgi:hypothetical protein
VAKELCDVMQIIECKATKVSWCTALLADMSKHQEMMMSACHKTELAAGLAQANVVLTQV